VFTFVATDGTANSETVTVNVTVTPVNDAPVAQNQAVSTNEDIPVAITLIATDVDNDPLQYLIVSQPANGTLSTLNGASVTYTPAEDFNGADSFTFRVSDGLLSSNIATVTITVVPINDPPKFTDVEVLRMINEDTIDTPLINRIVCKNAFDDSGAEPTYTFVKQPNPGGNFGEGDFVIIDDVYPNTIYTGFCYVYIPGPNYNGETIFDLVATDGNGLSSSIPVKITLLPVNDKPFAVNDYVVALGGVTSIYNVVANDSAIIIPYKEFYDIYEDDSVDVVTITNIVKGPFYGIASVSTDGLSIEYFPQENYLGPDSVVYRIKDSTLPNMYDTAVLFIDATYAKFKIYEGLSPNGDEVNDYWRIDGIEEYPNSVVRVFDRFNNLVFETKGYSNLEPDNNWRGQATRGLGGDSLPEGTYYYTVYLGNGGATYSGYVFLKRN
jgi:gliding motility-associated-like protein